jgi:hypothetical protein
MVENGQEQVEHTTAHQNNHHQHHHHHHHHHHNESNNSTNTSLTEDSTPAISLPNDCLPLTHQVAGHFYGKGRTKLGLLQTSDGLVLKPVQSPPRGEREHNFFKRIFLSDDAELNEDEIQLRQLLPIYRGSFVHNESRPLLLVLSCFYILQLSTFSQF